MAFFPTRLLFSIPYQLKKCSGWWLGSSGRVPAQQAQVRVKSQYCHPKEEGKRRGMGTSVGCFFFF
jgi:hypothetical protein